MTQSLKDNWLRRPGLIALSQGMARFGSDRESPVRAIMGMLGDRWTTLILLVLQDGPMRHADLKRALATLSFEQAISQRVLTLKLRALERDSFVLRMVSEDVPPKVIYRLSDLGHALTVRTRDMIAWINARSAEIHDARAHYDKLARDTD